METTTAHTRLWHPFAAMGKVDGHELKTKAAKRDIVPCEASSAQSSALILAGVSEV